MIRFNYPDHLSTVHDIIEYICCHPFLLKSTASAAVRYCFYLLEEEEIQDGSVRSLRKRYILTYSFESRSYRHQLEWIAE